MPKHVDPRCTRTGIERVDRTACEIPCFVMPDSTLGKSQWKTMRDCTVCLSHPNTPHTNTVRNTQHSMGSKNADLMQQDPSSLTDCTAVPVEGSANA